MKVFVTDADYKQTLSAARSLGEKGIDVLAGSSYRYAQTFYSKYCREKLVYPSAEKQRQFIGFIIDYVRANHVDVILPIGYYTTIAFSKYKLELGRHTKLPIADYDSMQIACNKEKTIALARKLGITTPKSYTHTQTIEDFPIVAKGVEGTGQVRYISHPNDLASIPSDGVILQEYIPGEACGFFALFNQGNIRAFFMHRRIKEYPVTGGPSTKAESIYDPELKEKGLTLLNALNWHGLAMVEFKRDNRNGELTLMEINPKFWGSMDLAIAAGVDFPYLAVRMAAEGDIEPVYKYNEGVKFRWPFPEEVLHLLARPSSLRSFFQDCIDKGVRSNLSLKDIKPNLFQIVLTVSTIATRIRHKSLLYPHGRPFHEA